LSKIVPGTSFPNLNPNFYLPLLNNFSNTNTSLKNQHKFILKSFFSELSWALISPGEGIAKKISNNISNISVVASEAVSSYDVGTIAP